MALFDEATMKLVIGQAVEAQAAIYGEKFVELENALKLFAEHRLTVKYRTQNDVIVERCSIIDSNSKAKRPKNRYADSYF